MYRVLVPALLSLLLAGCGMANSSLSSGFANSGQPTSSLPTSRTLRSTAAATETKVASADDKIPKGSFERAPTGALADRDYSGARLDPEKARELINAYRKEHGLKPVRLNAQLTIAARAHAKVIHSPVTVSIASRPS